MKRKGKPCLCVYGPLGIGYKLSGDPLVGIAACSRCGGLGRVHDDPVFRAIISRVAAALTAYAPPDLPAILKLQSLKLIDQGIKELYSRFGETSLLCYARLVSKGHLREEFQRLELLQEAILDELEGQRKECLEQQKEEDDQSDLNLVEADILAHTGYLDEADALYQKVLRLVPESLSGHMQYAVFLLLFRRSPELALKVNLSAGERLGNASFFYNAALCYQLLGQPSLYREYMLTAKGCPGAESIAEEIEEHLEQSSNDVDLSAEDEHKAARKFS